MNFKKERTEIRESVESDIQKTFTERKWVWVPDEAMSFLPGYIVKEKGDTLEVDCDGNIRAFNATEVMRMNPPKFDMAEDLAALSHLNEPSVLYNLTKRYNNGHIYTYSGLFLLAINPYRNLNIYSQNHIKKYTMGKKNELDPHIFAVANEAYNLMLSNRENQSVLITGESGAGKTENTKKVIEFLASVAGYKTEDISIDKKIIDSNPILEAFGNAKTVKNDNSSRFGKFIQIKFNGGNICGANIEKYLLEKSRITGQNNGERNYHIFYQLLFGADTSLKQALYLDGSVDDYRFLKGGAHKIEGVDDAERFRSLRECMRALDISEETEVFYYKIVAAVLHLGNLEFRTSNKQVEIVNIGTVDKICKLLKISSSDFIKSLIHPVIKAGHEIVTQHRSVEQVYRIVEALAKILYDKMFDSLIVNLNRSLGTTTSYNFIGVLDIAGFEIFKDNSFEQLCINYTNEKLQQFFNHHMFILEQEIYRQEDIEWDFIDFGLDLQPTIDLIESNNPIGIMSYLDEECVMPCASEKTFLEKLLKNIKSNKFKRINFKDGFKLQHYAGDVEYNVSDWITKNKDPNSENLTSLINRSEDRSVSSLSFAESSNLKKGIFRTVSQKHKEQLLSLMRTLSSTQPHFVRCIIPNLRKTGDMVDNKLILEQLKCNGVLEGIRISRQGFPSRMKYCEFVERYRLLGTSTLTQDNKESTKNILSEIHISATQYRLGKTRIFFRQSVLADIEDLRDGRISIIMRQVQALARKKMAEKKQFIEELRKKAICVLKKNAKMCVDVQKWNWWKLYLKIKPLLDVRKRDNELKEKEDAIKKHREETEKEREKVKELERLMKDLAESKERLLKNLEAEKEYSHHKDELMEAVRAKNEELEKKVKLQEIDNKNVQDFLEKTINKMKTKVVEEGTKEELEKVYKEKIEILENREKEYLENIKKLENREREISKGHLENLKKVKDENADLQIENEKLEVENVRLNRLVEEKEGEIKRAGSENEIHRLNIANLNKTLGILKEQLVEYEKREESERENKNLLDSTTESLLEKIKNYEKKIKNLESKIQHVEILNSQLSAEKEEIHKENLNLLQTKLDDIFERESQFNSVKKSLQIENQKLMNENQKLARELYEQRMQSESSDDSNYEKLYSLLEQEKKARREAEQRVVENEKKSLILKNELEGFQERYEEIAKERDSLLLALDSQKDQSSDYQRLHKEVDSLLEAINSVISGFHTKYFEILEDNRSRLAVCLGELEKKEETIKNLSKDLLESRNLVGLLEKKAKDLGTLNSINMQKINNLLNEFDNTKIYNLSLETEIEEKKCEIEAYKAGLENEKKFVEEIEKKFKEEISRRLREETLRNEEYLRTISSLKEGRNKLLEIEKKKFEALNLENLSLKREIEDLENKLVERLKIEETINFSITNSNSNKSNLVYITDKQKLEDLERKNLISKKELKENKETIENIKNLQEATKAENESLRLEISDLKSQVFELKKSNNTQNLLLSQIQRELKDEKELVTFLKPFSITRRKKK
ncbi:putative myosin heavy chain [Nosema granulosis]|uniref:Myosin heavy chain n=1 Tax=Nosema granulosis TaxID=83296 RepID=A0A9P6H055_9MICR|nr:putative myosin heavy chain [Nosema granulosis]